MPTVSVLIPVYNNAATLRECLDSVLSQRLGGLEVICVDDGSTDGSGAVLDEYAAAHGNMTVAHQSNRGAGVARNVALNLASGEFVAFMDGDDRYFDERALTILYEAARAYAVPIAVGQLCALNRDSTLNVAVDDCPPGLFVNAPLKLAVDYPLLFWFQKCLFRRDLLIRHALYFPAYVNMEDPVFLTRALATLERFCTTPALVYCHRGTWRLHGEQLRARAIADFWRAWLDLLATARAFAWTTLRERVCRELCSDDQAFCAQVHISRGDTTMLEVWQRVVQAVKSEGINEPQRLWESDVEAIRQGLAPVLTTWRRLRAAQRIAVYGAASVGQAVASSLRDYLGDKLRGFCLSAEKRPLYRDRILGLPVYAVDELPRDTTIIVAVRPQFQAELRGNLQRLGFADFLALDDLDLARDCARKLPWLDCLAGLGVM